jgi:gamma-glutamyltranspeptidase/glutathione hydrolase
LLTVFLLSDHFVKSLILILLLFTSVISNTFAAKSLSQDKQFEPEKSLNDSFYKSQNSSYVVTDHAAVSTSHPLATQAAINIMKKGGNATDAAIAAMLVLGVVEPQASGIGGGGFAIMYEKSTNKIEAFEGRESAPSLIAEDVFMRNGKPANFDDVVHTGSAVGVPGFVHLIKAMHYEHGSMPWYSLFMDASEAANKGFAVSERMAMHLSELHKNHFSDLDMGDWYIYFDKNKEPKKEGDIIQNPQLYRTLQSLAYSASPTGLFYYGRFAEDIVDKVKNNKSGSGTLDLKDINGYTSNKTEPICIIYRGHYKVCAPKEPSSAITVLEALKIIENFDIAKIYMTDLSQFINILLESLKFSFADRNLICADPKYSTFDDTKMISDDHTKKVAEIVQKNYRSRSVQDYYESLLTKEYNQDYGKSDTTTHVSVIDRFGNAVSFTNSIENAFGSLIMTNGFILNNTMTDFNFNPYNNGKKVANRPEPLKRPRSSMSPIIVIDTNDNSVKGVFGSPGGARIISYVLKSIIFTIDLGMDPNLALNLPNFATMNSGSVEIEKAARYASSDVANKLKKLGHKVSFENTLISGSNIIVVAEECKNKDERKDCHKVYKSAADYRRSGVADGF